VIVVDVTVHVPVEIQALHSKEAPGRLVVGIVAAKSTVPVYSLGVLCEPSTEPLVAHLHHEGFGCAKAGSVRAWVVPATDPGNKSSVACGMETGYHNVGPNPTKASPTGAASIFEKNTSSVGCSSGSASVEITVQPPPGQP